jgi:acetolactate synthase I/II/III large subunit
VPRLADPGRRHRLIRDVSTNHDGGEALLDALLAAGVEHVFSSPGSEWAPVWEAVARRARDGDASPAYRDLWHETVAVGMATGYGLVARRPAAVLLHAGAGLLQGASAIHGALLAGAPMLVCSSESITYGEGPGPDPGGQWYRNLSVVGGPQTFVAPYVKWANQVGSVHTLEGMVTRAVELARRAPTGPVYLNVPLEVLLDPVPARELRPVAEPGGRVSLEAELDEAAKLLAAAVNPVVVTESAGQDPAAYDALLELCELLALPVVEPQSAVAANFPRLNRLHQGANLERFADADVILLVNCRAPWYPPSARPEGATVVVVDDVPQRPHIVYQVLGADRYLEGDTAATLAGLSLAVHRGGLDEKSVATRRERVGAMHEALRVKLADGEATALAKTDAIAPLALVRALREAAPEDTLLVDETITHSRLLRGHLDGKSGSYLYVQGGLGQGLGVALGAKLAARDRTVVLAIGDGTFIYNPIVAALSAARDYDLPLLIVIFTNRQYLSMKMNHLRFYPEGAAVQTGDFRGVDLSTQPDLADLAKPFGMHAESVEEPAELSAAVERAFTAVASGTTAVLNVSLST